MSEENQAQESQLSEHDQAMVDKVDQHEEAVQDTLKTDEERMLAGKYKSVEELEKAYEHLQTKLGKPEENEVTETETPEETPTEASREDAEELVSNTGIDYSALEDEYAELGGLSEETYAQLEAAGIPQTMVDAYIAGQEAVTQNTINRMYDITGGEAEYKEMVQWAEDNLSESQINAFNESLTSEAQTEFAIQGLYAQYKADQGPNLVKGNVSNSSTRGFASKQEMMAEMANPQYKRDPAFRAEVQRRVALSNF